MAKFTPCPRCGRRAVYIVGGVSRIRRHSPWQGRGWCVAGGMSIAEYEQAELIPGSFDE